jgi:hypothetical protein
MLNDRYLFFSRRALSLLTSFSKIWDLPSFTVRETWTDAHVRHTIVRPTGGIFTAPVSTFGVMNVRFTSMGELYSCGADGRLRKYELSLVPSSE